MGCVPNPAALIFLLLQRLGHWGPFDLYTANTSQGGCTAQ